MADSSSSEGSGRNRKTAGFRFLSTSLADKTAKASSTFDDLKLNGEISSQVSNQNALENISISFANTDVPDVISAAPTSLNAPGSSPQQNTEKLASALDDKKSLNAGHSKNSTPIGNQLGTNSTPNRNQLVTNSTPIGNQLPTSYQPVDNQLGTNSTPVGNELPTDYQLVGNQLPTSSEPVGNQLRTNSTPNRNQLGTNSTLIGNQLVTNSTPISNQKEADFSTLDRLSNLGHSVLIFLYKESDPSTRVTKRINRKQIALALSSSQHSVGNRLRELALIGLIKTIDSKPGLNGWTIFEISKTIYTILGKETVRVRNEQISRHQLRTNSTPVDNQLGTNSTPIGNQLVTKHVNKPDFAPPSKEESKNIFNTNSNPAGEDPEYFRTLDFSPVPFVNWMQINIKIRKQVGLVLSKEEVQNFMNRFTGWIVKHQMETKQPIPNMRGMFCRKLEDYALQGDSEILDCPTDQELEAQKKYFEKIKELSELSKAAKSAELEESQKAGKGRFNAWLEHASDDELVQLAPPSGLAPLRSSLHLKAVEASWLSNESNFENDL